MSDLPSDLPSTNHHQPSRSRRAGRRRTAAARQAYTAKPDPLDEGQMADDATDPQAEEPTTASVVETGAGTAEDQLTQAISDAQGANGGPFGGRLTPLSKRILIWGGLMGVASLVISIAIGLALTPFSQTQADIQQYNGLLVGGYCLNFLFSLALPFVAGWRATLREGTGRNGGMAGLWSILVAAILGLIVDVVTATFQGKLQEINGQYFATSGENLILPLLIGFAMGAVGGSYSGWQRRRAQLRQETVQADGS